MILPDTETMNSTNKYLKTLLHCKSDFLIILTREGVYNIGIISILRMIIL